MNKKPTNHYESYEAACAYHGVQPEDCLPTFSDKAPGWLKVHLTTEAKLLVIAEAIRQGRVPEPGERMYFPIFFKDPHNNHAGFGLSFAHYDFWFTDTAVGERHEFFTREDAAFFATQFIALHKITNLITKIKETNV